MKNVMSPQQKAASTARWAITMTKVRIRKIIARTRWQLVTFTGPAGGESVGIVDMLAIRKDHRPGANGLKRGDQFEVILIQVKGGSAAFPTAEEVERLRLVGCMYRAKAIVLGVWKRGREVELYRLQTAPHRANSSSGTWEKILSADELFR
jgi:hypothetical protein